MFLTREQLDKMDEDRLRRQVLIPLFKSMGYRDVTHYHGGPLEQGKDIVMWKPGDIRDRVNYGVVVKASKISGKAKGKGSSAEVLFQVEQCFGTPYKDQVTTRDQLVDHCYVISSQEITKEAINSIQGVLKVNNLDKVTDFIDGDALWGYIEKYQPERLVWNKLNQVQKVFDEASPYYRIVARTTGEGVHISLEPKSPEIEEEHPVSFNARFVFPNTPEGREIHDAFEKHIKSGTPVEITKPYIEEFNVPEFLLPILDPTGEGIGMVALGTQRSIHPLLVKIEVENEDGEIATLEYIHLNAIQTGTEESTFTNDRQPVPWKIKLVHNVKEKQMHFSYTFSLSGVNVKLALDALHFQQALARGGVFRIEHLDTGFELQNQLLPPGVIEAPDSYWIELLKKVNFIQGKTQSPISIPDRDLNEEDLRAIHSTFHILSTGHATLKANKWTVGITDMKFAQEVLEAFESGKTLPIRLEDDISEEIFDVLIPLGRVILNCDRVHSTKEDLAALRAAISASEPGKTIEIRLTPYEGCLIQAEYPKWPKSN